MTTKFSNMPLTVAPATPRILILTALVEEHRALVSMMTGSQALRQIDYLVSLTIGSADIDVLCLSNMGNVNAAAQTAFYIARYHPRYVILCGIAGGIRSSSKLALGDIIVAEQVVLYEASKIRRRRFWFTPEIERRLSSFPAGATLLRAARHLHVDLWPVTVMKRLQRERTGRPSPRVMFGPIASGEKVIADRSFLDPIIRSYPLLKGIEMEAGGVMSAAHSAGYTCESIVIKSVCDWADHRKNDEWHEFAAYAAATFVKHFVDRLAASLDPSAERTLSSDQGDNLSSTTAGLFIEFLNPESQRIYGLETLPSNTRIEQAQEVINAALFLCDRGVVFPIGTLLETPYLLELLPKLRPLINAGRIRFSMREATIDEFVAKRRVRYSDQRSIYPTLFDDSHEKMREAFPERSLVSKESHIGKRIAQLFSLGPGNLIEWSRIVAEYNSKEVTVISSIPAQLLAENRAVTWAAFEARLVENSIAPCFELRKLLQLTYCNIYVSEYGLEYLRNVEFAPFELLPASEMRRYDFAVLKRVLTVGGLWDYVVGVSAAGMLSLFEMAAYRTLISSYNELCRLPMSESDIDVLVRELRYLANGPRSKASSHTSARFQKERLVKAMRELRLQLALA